MANPGSPGKWPLKRRGRGREREREIERERERGTDYRICWLKVFGISTVTLTLCSRVRWIWASRYQSVSILDFTEVKDDGRGGDNWSYKTCKAPVKSSPPTNQQPVFLQAGMTFLSPNQQCQNTEGNSITFHGRGYPSSPGGLPALYLTINSCWLPWGRVAMSPISPLMPVHRCNQCLFCTRKGKTFKAPVKASPPTNQQEQGRWLPWIMAGTSFTPG